MKDIPVSFTHEGKEYSGHLSAVFGAGGNTWHLMINKRYWGQLVYTKNYGFQFSSNTEKMEYLSEQFGEAIMAWYQ